MLCERIHLHQSERLVLPMLVDAMGFGGPTFCTVFRFELQANGALVGTCGAGEGS